MNRPPQDGGTNRSRRLPPADNITHEVQTTANPNNPRTHGSELNTPQPRQPRGNHTHLHIYQQNNTQRVTNPAGQTHQEPTNPQLPPSKKQSKIRFKPRKRPHKSHRPTQEEKDTPFGDPLETKPNGTIRLIGSTLGKLGLRPDLPDRVNIVKDFVRDTGADIYGAYEVNTLWDHTPEHLRPQEIFNRLFLPYAAKSVDDVRAELKREASVLEAFAYEVWKG